MTTLQAQIFSISDYLDKSIRKEYQDRGYLSQSILSQARTLVESIGVALYKKDLDLEYDYRKFWKESEKWISRQNKRINYINKFHRLLQQSASHYTFDEDASERLMLKYHEYFMMLKRTVEEELSLEILKEIENFPLRNDSALRPYYTKIAEKINNLKSLKPRMYERFYINKYKHFIVDGEIYYEVSFSDVTDKINKTDRIIGFTKLKIPDFYALRLGISNATIKLGELEFNIFIISEYQVSIRPCELTKLSQILGKGSRISSGREYDNLMDYLTDTNNSILDLLEQPDDLFTMNINKINNGVKSPKIIPLFFRARKIINAKSSGHNVLRYLVATMNNRVLKLQQDSSPVSFMSNMHINRACYSFEKMPYFMSLKAHNPPIEDLLRSIPIENYTEELLARRIKNVCDSSNILYLSQIDFADSFDIKIEAEKFNNKLYKTHKDSEIIIEKDNIYIKAYENNSREIIEKILSYTGTGLEGYSQAIQQWLVENTEYIDDEKKKEILENLFNNSKVALIKGAAGTGKTYLLNLISKFFKDSTKLFLAHTNTATENLKRKIDNQTNTTFRTVASEIARIKSTRESSYDILFIDECSIVENKDIQYLLSNSKFKLLIIVGDIYQIESIRFGNWFDLSIQALPKESVFELVTPYRTNNETLQSLWSNVRNMVKPSGPRADSVDEILAQGKFVSPINETLFAPPCDDQIILCLGYDGLYGINNLNRFLQDSNPNPPVRWGINTYKIGDPIIFFETENYSPFLYNNLKGIIKNVVRHIDEIIFEIYLEKTFTSLDTSNIYNVEFINENNIRMHFSLPHGNDDDVDDILSFIPFQVTYAVSIHKAQGLEFNNVKLVITDENRNSISHNIFYTAITRSKNNLTIYWSPETQNYLLDSFDSRKSKKDFGVFSSKLTRNTL